MDEATLKELGITDEKQISGILGKYGESIAGLKANQQKHLDKVKEYENKYKDIDLEEYAALKKSKGSDSSLKGKVEQLEKLIADRDKAIADKEAKARNLWKDREVEKAIEAAGGIPRAIRREVGDMVQVVDNDGAYSIIVINKDGKERLNDKGAAFTLDDLLSEMKLSDDWAFGFKSSGLSGGAATNSNRAASGAKMLTRKQFDALSPAQKLEFSRASGKITD